MSSTASIDASLPLGAWDSHVHIVDEETFPLHPLHPFRPKKADLTDLLAFEQRQGVDHTCLVAFSVYHTDNSSIADALRRLDGQGRAVVCIDPEQVGGSELQLLHSLGARAVRMNFRTRGERLDRDSFARVLAAMADRIRPLGWAIQLYVSLDQVVDLAEILPSLGVWAVIIDHVGHPEPSAGPAREQKGYAEFMHLLRSGLLWTKLSGTYRFADLSDLDDYVLEILRTAPDRVVWASDWPHSGGVGANPGGDRNAVQEYQKVDDQAWIVRCKKWCRQVEGGDGAGLIRKIWVDNPRALWQYAQGK